MTYDSIIITKFDEVYMLEYFLNDLPIKLKKIWLNSDATRTKQSGMIDPDSRGHWLLKTVRMEYL